MNSQTRHLTLKHAVISLFLAFTSSVAMAQDNLGVATAGVNFRSAPNNGPVIGSVSAGTTFQVLGTSGGWSHVKLANGKTGYIFSQYISRNQQEVPHTEDLPTGVATTGVNFRKSPNGEIITGVGKGTFFDILGKQGDWTRVKLASGEEGYIFSRYVSTQAPEVPETEGEFCASCARTVQAAPISQAEDIREITNAAGAGGMCVTAKMIEGAKWVHRNKYGGREKGRGKCAKAVRQGLNRAGIWQGGGIGHAKDMMPGLKRMGFKNLLDSNPRLTPDSAPNGTILVYGAKKRGARGCTGLGSTYGHVEIKENDNSFIYDGKPSWHIQEAYPKDCRPLIGVMQMGPQCPTCTRDVKRACGV